MTLITRWEPFREFSVLQDRMNRLFQSNLAAGRDEELAANTGFAPAVDVYEDEHNITLKLEVPGIDEKDIDIRLENHTLTVRGERKLEKEEKEENFHRIERRYGSFFRSFTLRLRQGRSEDQFGQEGGSQAQADQSKHRAQDARL